MLKSALNLDRYAKPTPYEVPLENKEESTSNTSQSSSENSEEKKEN